MRLSSGSGWMCRSRWLVGPIRRRSRAAIGLVALGLAAAALLLASDFDALPVSATPVCENGAVIPDPSAKPELVGDCTVLLELKATLAGTATVNWGATTALTSWDGVSVTGHPQRVSQVALNSMSLNGTIPRPWASSRRCMSCP